MRQFITKQDGHEGWANSTRVDPICLLVVFAVLVCAAGYFGLVPEAAMIARIPLALVASGIITAGMIYILSRAEN
jgi:hypothetical protein